MRIIVLLWEQLVGIFISGFLITAIIEIANADKMYGEIFIWNPDKKVYNNYLVIHKETTELDSNNTPIFVDDNLFISTNDLILEIKIYNCIFEDNKIKKTTIFKEYDRLSNKEGLILNTPWIESYPQYIIEWRTPSFMKGSLTVNYTNKSIEKIKYKHTLKSIVYYLFYRR